MWRWKSNRRSCHVVEHGIKHVARGGNGYGFSPNSAFCGMWSMEPSQGGEGLPPSAAVPAGVARCFSRAAAVVSEDGAALCEPPSSLRQLQQRQQPAAAASSGSPAFESNVESDGERLQSDEAREHVEEVDGGSERTSDSAHGVAPDEASAAQNVSDEASEEGCSPTSAEAVAARFSAMFVSGAAEPVCSGLPRLGREVTGELVRLAAAHVLDTVGV